MKVLIIYGSTEGQTKKIAGFLKEEAEKSGLEVTLTDSTDNPPAPAGYDLVLIGASVHMHKYQSAVLHYVKNNIAALNKTRSGFFSVSMAAASGDAESRKELEGVTNAFLKETGWIPAQIEQVAGALMYTQYDFFKKLVMRLIAKRHGENTDTSGDHEYTDWTKLKAFLEKMVKAGAFYKWQEHPVK
jgi:menaquinone-dependent protoporphyrinogen oxidase